MSEVPAYGLSQEEGLARIRLIRSKGVGPVAFAQLLRRFGTAREALLALPELAAQGGRAKAYLAASEQQVVEEIRAVKAARARYLFHDSPEYPALLREVVGAPPIVIVRGTVDLARRTPVAMVGARNASAAAVKIARQIARDLAEAGYPVVSGLARGVDGAAHEGALIGHAGGASAASTIAVIAGGIDVAYPPEHADLQERIAQEGLLITEVPPGVEPTNRHFPARNRIIAGMAAGTVVVEAAMKSGSLITARIAGEYGREVMAVPGSPLDPRSHGGNDMIREGAILVQRAQDIIELITSFDGVARSHFHEEGAGVSWARAEEDFGLGEERTLPAWVAAVAPEVVPEAEGEILQGRVLDLLSVAPVGVDELVRQVGGSAASVQRVLVELELAGEVLRHTGGRVSRAAV